MTTNGFCQMFRGTLGVNNTHNGWVETDGTVSLHDCDYRWEVELNVVDARRSRDFDRLTTPNTPGSNRLLRVLH